MAHTPGDSYEVGEITSITRLYNSVNGNPRFAIAYETPSGEYRDRVMMSDTSSAYEVGNPGIRVGCTVRFALTRAGRIRHIYTYADQLI